MLVLRSDRTPKAITGKIFLREEERRGHSRFRHRQLRNFDQAWKCLKERETGWGYLLKNKPSIILHLNDYKKNSNFLSNKFTT